MSQKPIDISRIDLEELKSKTAEEPGLLPYAHTTGGAVIRPEDLGRLKGRAVTAMRQQTELQLAQIFEQIELLAQQAQTIQDRVQISERIYLARIPFEPVIGKTYYLYRKSETQDVLSMIAPQEWGARLPYETHLAAVKLLADHTWEILEQAS